MQNISDNVLQFLFNTYKHNLKFIFNETRKNDFHMAISSAQRFFLNVRYNTKTL